MTVASYVKNKWELREEGEVIVREKENICSGVGNDEAGEREVEKLLKQNRFHTQLTHGMPFFSNEAKLYGKF